MADELFDEEEEVEEPPREPSNRRLPAEVVPAAEPEVEETPESEPELSAEARVMEVETEPEPRSDEVEALFASLRGAPIPTIGHDAAPQIRDEVEPDEKSPVATMPPIRSEVIEQRDARLLPITNRALRGVKKAVTDAQNLALDSLRTDDSWHPDSRVLAEMMQADLKGLWAESYSAGHAAAEEMVGSKLKRRDTPSSQAAEGFGEDLSGAVANALIDAGDGLREKQSATSRVFRGWRTDEAERRVRQLALVGYHRGLVDSVGEADEIEWVPSGTPCSACREAAAEPGSHLPPVHAGCECTLNLVNA